VQFKLRITVLLVGAASLANKWGDCRFAERAVQADARIYQVLRLASVANYAANHDSFRQELNGWVYGSSGGGTLTRRSLPLC
jgi:hypothetical protein